jgi:hypothetical protein
LLNALAFNNCAWAGTRGRGSLFGTLPSRSQSQAHVAALGRLTHRGVTHYVLCRMRTSERRLVLLCGAPGLHSPPMRAARRALIAVDPRPRRGCKRCGKESYDAKLLFLAAAEQMVMMPMHMLIVMRVAMNDDVMQMFRSQALMGTSTKAATGSDAGSMNARCRATWRPRRRS